MGDSSYRPGDIVPSNGVYKVIHDKHRLMHEATLTKGMLFPMCLKCDRRVRFILVRSINHEVVPFGSGQILIEYSRKKSKATAV